MSTAQQLITADEFLRWPRDGYHHELWQGEVGTMRPSGSRHGQVAVRIGRILDDYVSRHQLGAVTGSESGYLLEQGPDTVLAPDVEFIRRERIAPAGLPDGFFVGPPDIAVEVQSPSDSEAKVLNKVNRWLQFGTRQVWVAWQRTQIVDVYAPGALPITYRVGDQLPGGEVLPGFSVAVAEIFAS